MTERPATESHTPHHAPARWLRRGPLPVLWAALACFLVVFALLTARIVRGSDPGLRPSAQASLVAKSGHVILRTTASGRTVRETAAPGAAPKNSGEPSPLVTRASGAAAGEDDG